MWLLVVFHHQPSFGFSAPSKVFHLFLAGSLFLAIQQYASHFRYDRYRNIYDEDAVIPCIAGPHDGCYECEQDDGEDDEFQNIH